MIQYSLKCADGHQFDSWFQSSDAYDKLRAAGHVACAVCGDSRVEKALMAPRVQNAEDAPRDTPRDAPRDAPGPLSRPASPAEQALARLRRHVEENSDYVGKRFVQEARAMHLGDAPDRPIWGEAKREDARKLIEDGIPIAPLPFAPFRKTS